MKISIITLGCKVNQYESAAIKEELIKMGHEVVEKLEPADLYILNTCAVTGIAEKKSRTHIAKFYKLNSSAKVIVCGCASQHNTQQFLAYQNVSAVIGTTGKSKIANILEKVGDLSQEISNDYENFNCSITSKTRAFVKIQDGCNNFCSYCLIPYVRGRSRSRDINEIIKEATELQATNNEIVLTGINISDYKVDEKLALPMLMSKLSSLSSRVRIGSLEVNIITEEFLKILSKMPNFCPQFHLSMQSGCNRILKLMNRHYTKEMYLEKVALIQKHFKNATITTDVIVGFPTETEEDFAETVETIKTAKFYEMHIFPYSKRDGTVASKLKMCDGNIVKQRVKILEEINRHFKTEYIQQHSNDILHVLTENFEGEYMVGHTENYIKVYLPKDTPRHKIIKVSKLEPYLEGAKAEIVNIKNK